MTAEHRLEICIDLLNQKYQVANTNGKLEQYAKYVNSITKWNPVAKLVSSSNLDILYDHIADSLTLLPYVNQYSKTFTASYIDVGSGGGFPAVPIAINCPGLQIFMVEAHQKKCTFLEKMVRQLQLSNVTIICDRLENLEIPGRHRLFTARAIEKPLAVSKQIAGSMRVDDLYLAQTDSVLQLKNKNFIVKEINDEFDQNDVRRGKVYSVSRYT
jgi:16S rRNA (guanine(527)-N(7))-methyltransferase RsmG